MTQPIHPMLERVARAIHEGLGESWAYSNHSGDEWNDASTRKMLDEAARAAVQALIEGASGLSQWEYERDALDIMLRPLVEGEG